ncbi:hypothetical protein [Peristeroidobacter agariperforans]|uniref:hypothetical protein n=1 Tax=Peristeroidobacter agariperforans TaxID=268404 RepID=UPI001300374C|nr:hypothetical protein [Peristeroidobacter agariperforans]
MDKALIWTAAAYRRPMTLQEYQYQSRVVLAELENILPEFKRSWIIGQNDAQALPTNLIEMDHAIADSVFDDAHLSDYLHLTDSGRLGPQSLSRIGFSLTYGLTDAEGQSMLSLEEGGAYLALQGTSASDEPTTSSVLELAAPLHSRQLRQILQILVASWPASFGGASIPQFQQSVRGANRGSYAGQWLFYLPLPHLSKCLPPDIRHEPFANGILIETTPHMPDANNPADVEAGKRVRDVLDEFGLVNDATYAIEGWPPDQEETIYEQFISGAPADRKYTVHCINFDGYDPDRKVLLYAKLFRRLKRHPKEWGFRGWDGPVLNEAKRQVRAAAKAGGVPIEWHIGLEEPVHQVRQLLADHTNITEKQLRVIYTPLEQALNRPPP